MIAAPGLRWLLTALCELPALYALRAAVARGTAAADRVGHALHAAMGLLMVAMVWPWVMGLARAFDAARSAADGGSGAAVRNGEAAVRGKEGDGALGLACHAAMGLGMAVMCALSV
ncbi:hypothetical protein ADL22_18445 [Streptomyces sp. NRRL F-4489]|uniref:DUF5134 domain-containing protein n=1 Tax=Streptomyces sp. NRRL F-4489 TaxID=1609095 RepID=UPI00074901D9|nr:DUF5134 domain-containing protein [Streptomyces sp. NRRL F-4489]KUL38495.1 hypothetical protein ADL22_18445 [Streptomyces sp. NRRL F-4489]